MQQLIGEYLLKFNTCEIPNLGILSIEKTPASFNFGEQIITAPKPIITFLQKEITNDNFANYVATQKNISLTEANNLVANFTNSIHALSDNNTFEVENVGTFSKNENDKIAFEAVVINPSFTPAVSAVKVIHPNESHSITVGDTETNSTTMTEYYADETPQAKSRWWIWALVLGLISIATLLFNYFGSNNKGVGNVMPVEKIITDSGYSVWK